MEKIPVDRIISGMIYFQGNKWNKAAAYDKIRISSFIWCNANLPLETTHLAEPFSLLLDVKPTFCFKTQPERIE